MSDDARWALARRGRSGLSAAREVPESAALDRMKRALLAASGLASIVFGAIHVPVIVAQWSAVRPWFAVLAVLAGIVAPGALVVLANTLHINVLRVYAIVAITAFVLAQAAWPAVMVVPRLDETPWMQGLNAIPALVAAVVSQRWPVWVFAVIQMPLISATEYVTTGNSAHEAVLSGVVALLFAVILVGAGTAMVRAAGQQDAAAIEARAVAAREAAARTVEREQARINGIVHDQVLSALVLAAREPHSISLLAHASAALASLESVASDAVTEEPYAPAEAINALRAAAEDPDGRVQVWTTATGDREIPAPVLRALCEATAEAVRNSLAHATRPGGPVERVAEVSVTKDGVEVVVRDDGQGFKTSGVTARRLGLRVSIIERMRLLPGGDAQVDSRRGQGTTVTLTWTRGDE